MTTKWKRRAPWCATLATVVCLGCGGGATNQPPVAVATAGSNALLGSTVAIDGTQSTDPEGTALQYQWTMTARPPGSVAAPAIPTSGRTTFLVDVSGDYALVLSVSDGALSSTATVSVSVPAVVVGVRSQTLDVLTNGRIQFAATVSGAVDETVQWRASSGTIDTTGLLTAPGGPGPVLVTATSNANPAKSASATVTVAEITVSSIGPPSPSVVAGGQLQLTATASGWPDTSLLWSASTGSIDQAGAYRAPAIPGLVQVRATSNADPTKASTTTVTVTCNDTCPAAGVAECTAGQVRTCVADGYGCLSWNVPRACQPSFACDSASGSCRLSPSATSLDGTLQFDALPPNASRTDWSTVPVSHPAAGFMVISQYPDPLNPGAFLTLDTSVTGDATSPGSFSVQVRAAPARTADDRVIFAALGVDDLGNVAYAVADPGVTGLQTAGVDPASPRIWNWWAAIGSLGSANLRISTTNGSGAANVFDWLDSIQKRSRATFGRWGLTSVAWVGMGTTWSCGACFARWSTTVRGTPFQSQVWMNGDSVDQGYWSDAVMAHEMGHWAMASHGRSPNEGGTHYVGVPTYPGQAWSEGWATFFGAEERGDPVYLDQQDGSMFWFSLGARSYGGYPAWSRPSPSGGLLQMLDENDVAATLWDLSGKGASSGPLLAALASPRMNTSPFLRGYTRHTWTTTSPGVFVNVVDTGVSAPALPDFLDALTCAGFSRTTMDSVVLPSIYYPYPSASPLCP